MDEKIIKQTHELLNKMYTARTTFEEEFKNRSMQFYSTLTWNNYILIDGEYEIQKYPVPVLQFDRRIGLAFGLENIWLELCWLEKEELNKENIEFFRNNYKKFDIYGGDEFFTDYYYPDKSTEDIVESINNSQEKFLQMCFYFEYDDNNTIELFLKLFDIFKK